MGECNVILHISDRDKWSSALNQALYFAGQTSSSRIKVIIVADIFAGAVCVACDRRLRDLMGDWVAGGHEILVCEQSLRNLNLRLEALPEFVRKVPNALAEIVQRQREGFHYIKV